MKVNGLAPIFASLTVALMSVAMAGLNGVSAQSAVDYDADDDGLIEIEWLEQLDAVRWDLDGDGLSKMYASTQNSRVLTRRRWRKIINAFQFGNNVRNNHHLHSSFLHFGSGIATGVPFSELLRWDTFQESFNVVQRTRELISFGIIGFLMMAAAGLTVFLVAYMVYARWREKRMWSDLSGKK